MPQMLALAIMAFILFIGELISIRTKAWIPSIFVSGVLFLIGYWTFFPEDIVTIGGIPPVVATLLIYLLITNMGTLLSLDELKKQWRTILIALSGILGIVVFLLAIGTLLFDFQTVIVAIPPLVGGLVSALIMSEGATAAGLPTLAVFAIVIYVIQGFAGYPLTSVMLKEKGAICCRNTAITNCQITRLWQQGRLKKKSKTKNRSCLRHCLRNTIPISSNSSVLL